MTTGSLSANEGSLSELGEVVQSNLWFYFKPTTEGADVFTAPLAFPLDVSGGFYAVEGSDYIASEADVIVSGDFDVLEGYDFFESSANLLISGIFGSVDGSDSFVARGYSKQTQSSGGLDWVQPNPTFKPKKKRREEELLLMFVL